MQDVLSLDNELLKYFKIKNLIKPKGNISRMPWFYIIRLINALSNHILIKPYQGLNTICWRHDIFKQVVSERYLSNLSFANFKLNLNSKMIAQCIHF